MRAVNLLPRDDAGKGRLSKENWPVAAAACVAVLVLAFVGMQYMSQRGNVAAAQTEVADLRTALAAMPQPPEGPSTQEQQLVGEHDARLTALRAALKNRVAWDRVLREFALVIPNDVWLTDLTVKAPVSSSATVAPTVVAGAAAAAPDGFTISGYTYSHASVARLLARMSVLPDLDNVQLVSSSLAGTNGRPIVKFAIAAALPAAKADS